MHKFQSQFWLWEKITSVVSKSVPKYLFGLVWFKLFNWVPSARPFCLHLSHSNPHSQVMKEIFNVNSKITVTIADIIIISVIFVVIVPTKHVCQPFM